MIVSRMYFGALTESAPWHCIWERQVQALWQGGPEEQITGRVDEQKSFTGYGQRWKK